MSTDSRRRAAFMAHRQGLDGSLVGKSAEEILSQVGWARSVGGANPYLTLFARGGISREVAEEAAKAALIHELPSARGCTYFLPRPHYSLGLTICQLTAGSSEINSAKKHLGVTDEELERLDQAVLSALATTPKNPKELKDELGDLVRNLGEAGKKRGMTTTLPLALGKLQQLGQIRRVPIGGRLDQERYAYVGWADSPLCGGALSSQEAGSQIARLFWEWIGMASMDQFKWFTGFTVKLCKEATAELNLVPVADGGPLLMLREVQEEWKNFEIPEQPQYRFVSALDSLVLLRRSLEDCLDESGREHVQMLSRNLMDLESHIILDRGRIIGLWEYDAENGELVWRTWEKGDGTLKEVADEFEGFVRDQLGDARSFSLDSPASRRAQIEKIRAITP